MKAKTNLLPLNPTNHFDALRRGASLAVLGAVLFTATGCAMFTPKTPEQKVSERAAEYWKARKAADFATSYTYTTPSFRKVKTLTQYQQIFGAGASITQAEVSKVVCAPQRCDVQMKLHVLPFLGGLKIPPIDTYVNEVWLLEDGQWWFFQEL